MNDKELLKNHEIKMTALNIIKELQELIYDYDYDLEINLYDNQDFVQEEIEKLIINLKNKEKM